MKLPTSIAKGLIGGLISDTFKDIYNIYLEELKEFTEDYINTELITKDDTAWVEIGQDSPEAGEIVNAFKNQLIERIQEIKISFNYDPINIPQVNEPTE